VKPSRPGALDPSQSHTACFTSFIESGLSSQIDLASGILENPEPPISILLQVGLRNKDDKKLTAPSFTLVRFSYLVTGSFINPSLRNFFMDRRLYHY